MSTQKNNDDKIDVVLMSSDYYAPYAYVCMLSILKHSHRQIVFHILSDNLTNNTKRIFDFLGAQIIYHNIDISTFPTPRQARVHSVAYAKIFLPELLPDLRKVLVLDCDLIVRCDVAEIYDVDLGSKYIAWVPDPMDINLGADSRVRKIGLTYQYINTGVYLIDLDKWRRDGISGKVWETYYKYKELIAFFDQDLLYILLSEKCIYLDYVYNYLPGLKYQKNGVNSFCDAHAKILHFGSDMKPWLFPNIEFASEWWQYARTSPYYEEILCRMIIHQNTINTQETGKQEVDKLKCEFTKIHFPNINQHIEKNEKNLKLLFVIEHASKYRIKMWRYGIKKAFSFGIKRKKYQQKYDLIRQQLKEANTFKKLLYDA